MTVKLAIIERTNPVIKQRRIVLNMTNNGTLEYIIKTICRSFSLIGEIIQLIFDFDDTENKLIQFKSHFTQFIVVLNAFYIVNESDNNNDTNIKLSQFFSSSHVTLLDGDKSRIITAVNTLQINAVQGECASINAGSDKNVQVKIPHTLK